MICDETIIYINNVGVITSIYYRLKGIIMSLVNVNMMQLNLDTINELENTFIAFDFETTGRSSTTDRIIEIGAVLFENGIPVSRFQTLVNTGVRNPPSAQKINKISNAMLDKAPKEADAYKAFINFLGYAMQGGIPLVGHNAAAFDIKFLESTFNRLGYYTNIRLIDTLYLSRELVNMDHHRLGDMSDYFNIDNPSAHRADSDAYVCGCVLNNLIELKKIEIENSIVSKSKNEEPNKPIKIKEITDDEIELYAFIHSIISSAGYDTKYLGFKKYNVGSIGVFYYTRFLTFKFSNKGVYVVVSAEHDKIENAHYEPCSSGEGGSAFLRYFISSPFELENIREYIIEQYLIAVNNMHRPYMCNDAYLHEYMHSSAMSNAVSDRDVTSIVGRARQTKKSYILKGVESDNLIVVEDILRNTSNRTSLEDLDPALLDEASLLSNDSMIELDRLIATSDYEQVLVALDELRMQGFLCFELYNYYSKTYRLMQDFESEIVILNEGLMVLDDARLLNLRNEVCISLLERHQGLTADRDGHVVGTKRPVIQYSLDGKVLFLYTSISEASRAVGVNAKSIRETCNGAQKKAGNYKWEYYAK